MNALYFVFANDPKRPLDELKHEDTEINRLIDPFAASGHLRNVWDSFATLDKVTEKLLNNRQDLILFHYSGHAGSDMLGMEGGLAYATGIAEQLAACPQLRVVVLNGCATHGQVQRLHDLGIPAVVATYRPVEDSQAAEFAIRFYRSLVQRETLETAFRDAGNYILAKDNGVERDPATRGLALRHKSSGELCWALLFKPGSEHMATWSLLQNPPPSGSSSDFPKKIKTLVASGKVEDALNEMFKFTQDTNEDAHNQIVQLSGEWKQLARKIRIGIIGNADASIERNKIVLGILDLLQELTGASSG